MNLIYKSSPNNDVKVMECVKMGEFVLKEVIFRKEK
jgi:hypothetical protein